MQGAEFSVKDATKMTFVDNTFDTVVLYNAFFHIQKQWNDIENECRGVLKENGSIIITSTWSLEYDAMMKAFEDKVHQDGDFLTVRIRK